MGITNDKRTEDEKRRTTAYVVGTDSFMSGWGLAEGGKSYYALAILDHNREQAEVVEENMRARSDMKRVRFNLNLPRVGPNDHLSIAGPTEAGRHYKKGGFSREK